MTRAVAVLPALAGDAVSAAAVVLRGGAFALEREREQAELTRLRGRVAELEVENAHLDFAFPSVNGLAYLPMKLEMVDLMVRRARGGGIRSLAASDLRIPPPPRN